MSQSPENTAAARQIEIIVRKLTSVSTLPHIAVKLLSELTDRRFESAELEQLIESDPSLTAKIFSLAYQEGVDFDNQKPSVRQALDKLSPSVLRDAILSVKVFQAFDIDYDPDRQRALPRKQMVLHSLAVACCAKLIAALIEDMDEQLAFSAGLLHDIGKHALDEVMPKSFQQMVEQAKSRHESFQKIEQENLGIDHTVIGKRLLEKWHLPQEIVFAAWLHHSDIDSISNDLPQGKIARIVHLADMIARLCDLGRSGSCNQPDNIESLAASLGIESQQLDRIKTDLPAEVLRRSRLLGLDLPAPHAAYSDLVQSAAAGFAHDNSVLSAQNKKLTLASGELDFANEFLKNLDETMSTADIAAEFAARWQRFFQTASVCVYTIPAFEENFIEAVVIDQNHQTKIFPVEIPAGRGALPAPIQKDFKILDACENLDWFLEQIETEFNPARTRVIPLLSSGRAVGAVIFDLPGQLNIEEQISVFSVPAGIAAAVIALSLACRKQEKLSEKFAALLDKLNRYQQTAAETKSILGIAEMAAGAAHELNNPLAVISGRAELLSGIETDQQKKQVLDQIKQRAAEMSAIISDLMTFAVPQLPTARPVNLRTLLETCFKTVIEKHNLRTLEVKTKGLEDLPNALIDSAQITTALVNILSNALESYNGGNGPIEITAEYDSAANLIKLQVIDSGCGMDAQTLQKATTPFFSAKPAGRKHGMGLAHAQRLIRLNNGSLDLNSHLGAGTTVTVCLPAK